jgi:23S rRNA pseudouridine2605 synthase
LDINTEGLLLLTNDGGMKRFLELPSTGWLRRYRVRAFGKADEARLAALKKGIEIDGVNYRSIEATLERVQGGNVWLTMALREGKNREIKKVLEALDLKVNRLIRLSFGPFQLGQLDSGRVEEVPRRVLRQQLGKNWQAIVDGTIPKGGDDNADEPPSGKPSGGDAKGRKPRGDKPRAPKSKGPQKNARHKR